MADPRVWSAYQRTCGSAIGQKNAKHQTGKSTQTDTDPEGDQDLEPKQTSGSKTDAKCHFWSCLKDMETRGLQKQVHSALFRLSKVTTSVRAQTWTGNVPLADELQSKPEQGAGC